MGFKIYSGDNFPPEKLVEVHCYYDPQTGEVASADNESRESVTFACRPLLAGDMAMMSGLQEAEFAGIAKMVCAMVVKVVGLEDSEGGAIEKLTEEIVDILPMWMVNQLVQGVTSATNLSQKDANFSGPQSGLS